MPAIASTTMSSTIVKPPLRPMTLTGEYMRQSGASLNRSDISQSPRAAYHSLNPTGCLMTSRMLLLMPLLGVASCRDPRAEANVAQAMIDVGTEVSSLRQDYAVLQSQVDSLQGVVARQ